MDEEATHTRLPSASPLTNSGGGNKRSESPRSSVSGGRLVPHYLRASTGSCHDFCKHGTQEDRVSGFKDSRPWRKPVAGKGREDTAVLNKTVVVKSKPSADNKIMSMGADMVTTTEYINLATEQASSCSTTTATGEPFTSYSPETTITPSVERTKQQSLMPSESVIVATERDSLGAKDLKFYEKSLASSPSKPFLRSPSPISAGSNAARSVDGRKSMEGRKSMDGRKVFESSKCIDERKNVQGRNTRDESKSLDKCMSIVPDTTQKYNGHGENAEHYSQDGMSEDKMKGAEGSQSSPEMESSEESSDLRLKDHTDDDSLGNGTISGKTELSKKQAAVPKPVILKMKASPSLTPVSAMPPSLHPSSAPSRNLIAAKPPSPLHPSSAPSRSHIAAKPPSPLHPSSAPSRSHIAAKPPSPLHPSSAPSRSYIAAKPPSPPHPSSANSRNSIATRPSSPLHPSSGTCSKTINNNPAATKLSTSKLKMKKVDTSVVVSLSSGSSVDEGEISNTKQVRIIRVVSTKRRQRKVTNVAAKEHDDQGLKEDTSEAIKITPSKESVVNPKKEITNDPVRPSTPSVTKSIVRSRISYIPSRPKNSPAEPGQKTTAKVLPSSGLTKSKVVDSQPHHTHRPSTLKAGRVALIGETAHTNRRSLQKRISSGGITIEKSNSGRFLSRRPSAGQKKNAVLFNKVIEETASRLVRTSKSKVLALVGAFETVISIQRKSSAVSTPKSKEKSSSSKTYE